MSLAGRTYMSVPISSASSTSRPRPPPERSITQPRSGSSASGLGAISTAVALPPRRGWARRVGGQGVGEGAGQAVGGGPGGGGVGVEGLFGGDVVGGTHQGDAVRGRREGGPGVAVAPLETGQADVQDEELFVLVGDDQVG